MFDVAANTIFMTLAGSHAHGTAHAGSDVDLRGIAIAPLSLRVSYRRRFEQFEGALPPSLLAEISSALGEHPTAGAETKIEVVVFDIAKLFELASAANPNMLEILFADERDWVLERQAWRSIHAERERFLSQKVRHTYLGYALAQLKRIRTHRGWLLDPPKKKPDRRDFALPDQSTLSPDDRSRIEQAIAEKLRSWSIDSLEMPRAARIGLETRLREFWCDVLRVGEDGLDEARATAAAKSIGLTSEVIDTLGREKKYRAAMRHFESYQRWKDERNPARAELEARFGYDTKHAMHLVRLMRTGLELLETGKLRVRRGDAAELVAVRDGALSFGALLEETERLTSQIEQAAETSALPIDVDHDALERLFCSIVRAASP